MYIYIYIYPEFVFSMNAHIFHEKIQLLIECYYYAPFISNLFINR